MNENPYNSYNRINGAYNDIGNNTYSNANNANRVNARSIKKLKRANKRKNIYITILLFVVLMLAGVILISLFLQLKKSKETITEHISMESEVTARAYVWLNKIEDINLSYEDIKSYIGEINLEVIKIPTKEKGKYTYEIADSAYESCNNQAITGLQKAYKQAIKNRISQTGYSGEISDNTVEEIMMETFNMSVSEYLDQCDIKLLPSKDEILNDIQGR